MVRKTGWMILAILFFMSPLTTALGAWTNPDLLYSVAQAEKILGDGKWVILDCRGQEVYEKGHIPGAIVLGKKSAKSLLRDGSARTFQDPGKYEKILGEAGIGNAIRVLVYSDMKHKLMDDAFITFWLLEYLGHTDVHLLDGGFDAWTRAGKPVETAVAKREPAVFKAQPKKSAFATSEELLTLANGTNTNIQLVDCRTKEEFAGYDIRALRGGHIPNTFKNASHVTYFEQKKDEKTGKDVPTGILSEAAVAKALDGLDANGRVVFLCHSGGRSAYGYFAARLMGFTNAANYDDGWFIWATNYQKNYPVEDEQWIELARIDEAEKKIKSLETKISDLEALIKTLTDKK